MHAPGHSCKMDIDSLPRRMLDGEEDAHRAFAEFFGRRFRVYFRRRGLTDTEAEDLAVSCITDIVLILDKFEDRGPGSFEQWAFAIAHNVVMDWLKAQAPTVPLDEARHSGKSLLTGTEENESVRSAVREAIGELGEPDSTIMFMRLLEQPYTFSEIGRMLRIPEGTARVRHHRALKKLGAILQTKPAIIALLKRHRPRKGR